ncbi:MAG TPA: hypothetical protein VF552_10640 [Allosphingosinicella sp.]|jgi:hypothetical protein
MAAIESDALWTSRIGGSWACGIFVACVSWVPWLEHPSNAAPLALATLVCGLPGLAAASFVATKRRESIRSRLWLWCLVAPAAAYVAVFIAILALGASPYGAAEWAATCAACASAIFYAWSRLEELHPPALTEPDPRPFYSANRYILAGFFLAAVGAFVGEGSTRWSTATFGFYYITCLMPAFAAAWLLLLIYGSRRRVHALLLLAPPVGAVLLLVGYANINA